MRMVYEEKIFMAALVVSVAIEIMNLHLTYPTAEMEVLVHRLV